MKVVILAGGFGSRISEETINKPKPLIEIGGKPILWHIMKIYSHQGFNDFIICCGYYGYLIKEYFNNYAMHNSDTEVNLSSNSIKFINKPKENWKIKLIDTGQNTMTGGRIKRIKKFIKPKEDFFMTYGDGVSDVNLKALLKSHKLNKKIATVTAVQPPGRFGAMVLDKNLKPKKFSEKPKGDGKWINGGFFVLNSKIFNFIKGDETVFEKDPLEKITKNGQLNAYFHNGFWQPMDTLRDKNLLNDLYLKQKAQWKIW